MFFYSSVINRTKPKSTFHIFVQKHEEMKDILNDWKPLLLISLTLGLAPFTPEPHLFGKIRWILGGASGMQPMDWSDFLMHATP